MQSAGNGQTAILFHGSKRLCLIFLVGCSEKHCWGQGPWPRVHGSGLGDASDSDERSKR